jgi:gamma-glutamylcyclotransferase (GGCT)/AIG2-like uncharacterized protein YtfP
MARCLLFTYGLLQPDQQPPQSMSRSFSDQIRGRLIKAGEYFGLVDLDKGDAWVNGMVLEIDDCELPALDAFEETQLNIYHRKKAQTKSGVDVWVYEYVGGSY